MLAKPHRGERSWSYEAGFRTSVVGATGLDARVVNKNFRSPEMNQGDPSMSMSMETNTAAIYLRRRTESFLQFREPTRTQVLVPDRL